MCAQQEFEGKILLSEPHNGVRRFSGNVLWPAAIT